MKRRAVRAAASRVWAATANPDGAGLLLRGREPRPVAAADVEPVVRDALVRLARLAGEVADRLADAPDPRVRRHAAILAARAYPLRAALDD